MSHKLFAPLLSAALLGVATATVAAPAPLTLNIATNGNDLWSGRLATPNKSRTDGPLSSLAGARDRIRAGRGELRNHVPDLGQAVLSDAGLICCLGVSPGSVIRNNVFHDLWPYSAPALGWGIYLDAQCGNYLIESNPVYNTLSGGLMFNNGGHKHVIRNNIFAPSALAAQDDRGG